MRSDAGVDQAEGLRRMLVADRTRVIAVATGRAGMGRVGATLNLAAALAGSGKNVLVLDENHGPNNLPERLGLSARHDLLDVARGKCGLCDAVLAAEGFCILPVARAMRELAALDRGARHRLEEALTEAGDGADVVLVDAAMLAPGRAGGLAAAVPPSLVDSATLLLLVEATSGGITGSYALIKRLALKSARQQFGIAVSKAGSEQAALSVFENMAEVARRNLSVRLDYLGRVPPDEKPKYAKRTVESFPVTASAEFYLELSQKLLRLPACLGKAESGASALIQNLMKQVSHPVASTQLS